MKNRRGQATGWGQYVASVSAMTLLSGSDVTCHLAEVTFPPLSQSKMVINLVAKPVPLITKVLFRNKWKKKLKSLATRCSHEKQSLKNSNGDMCMNKVPQECTE